MRKVIAISQRRPARQLRLRSAHRDEANRAEALTHNLLKALQGSVCAPRPDRELGAPEAISVSASRSGLMGP
jgi:hypothetical protein